MSSGFVSSGRLESADADEIHNVNTGDNREASAVDAWAAADAAIKEAKEKAASTSGLVGSQEGGKSLYEVLQANKARKQEAFEEKLKFKNQFRSLDEGEVEFLDSIFSEQRAEEEAKKKELESRLDDFRKLQYEADHDPDATASVADESKSTWAVPARRKRKKDKEKDTALGANIKLRKMSDGTKEESNDTSLAKSKVGTDSPKSKAEVTNPEIVSATKSPTPSLHGSDKQAPEPLKPTNKDTSVTKPPAGLGGLVGYGSDSDSD
ncbi:hypothetical protein TWF173_008473 [Orbilia oligospora]|uniref:FAM192A/Fyv6 N-terminal domain-containing protein n=1 Tax=Arthrobotrys oligospora (strain ATCC 24927 / CBS 115.81 / DSM 1491) TaxID=756982 RepID=G1WZL9_ARTOA|nr:hypothetical protein AOL_s00006g70 [Orbilia oligospora ATCC 24927]EGX53612.1 hypothetical protein AOL_s00006g70 [Orbilia oligospora ATCC 24927]KAF3311328.1 hypothetical protein TWF173_008473 [Orbilia oligospora]